MAAFGALTASAWAGERVTLRNGFEMHCNHHAEVDGKVRLFPDATEDSYIEFGPQEIAAVEASILRTAVRVGVNAWGVRLFSR